MSDDESPIYEEIEVKFRVTDARQAHVLRTMPTIAERYLLTQVNDVINVDTYYDAADLRLLRHGQTLRVRAAGDLILMTSKSIGVHTPKGLHTREEIERHAPHVAADAPVLGLVDIPNELLEGVGEWLDAETELFPLVRLHQQRAKRDVLQPGRPEGYIAELSIDHVTVLRAMSELDAQDDSAESAVRWQPASHFTTLEVELAPNGERDTLREIALWLRAWPGLIADDQNKLQQALLALHGEPSDDAGDGEAGEPDHRQHMAELCRRVWGEQLRIMLVNEAGVRLSDDIEYVHDMRVATRRARAAGKLYAGYFSPRSKAVRRFMRHLRTTGRLLGSVRDLDVALRKLDAYTWDSDHGDDSSDGGEESADSMASARSGTDALGERWARKRARAHKKLVAWLDSKKYRRFVRDFLLFCATPGAAVAPFAPAQGEPPTPHQVRHVLPSLILGRYEAIRAFEVLFEDARATGANIPIETLHALRIECKYMRYHLEFSAELLGPTAAGLINNLKGLQEHLGDLNDASVSSALVATTLENGNDDVAAYAALQASTQELLRHSLPSDLAAFLSEETRRTLGLALARI